MTAWLAQLGFAHPAALWALLALPAIWWLLRTTPPRPRQVRFPPFVLLERLRDRRRQPARTPWWLLALRLLLAALLIVALAGPRLLPRQALEAAGEGPWLVVVDDGWAAARNWQAVRRVLADVLAEAQRRDAPVVLLTTTPQAGARDLAMLPPAEWRQRVRALRPQALDVERAAVARLLSSQRNLRPALVVWLSDGLDTPGAARLAQALDAYGVPVRVHVPRRQQLPLVLLPPRVTADGVQVMARRATAGGALAVPVVLKAGNGRVLAMADIVFDAKARQGEARLKVPPVLRNEAARLEIAGQGHAGAVWLLGEGFRRRTVLVVSGERGRQRQPLLSATYYVTRALAPFAEVVEQQQVTDLDRWLKAGLSMLVLADVGRLPARQERLVRRWVARGGVLLRFAGERIANADARLLPVVLRGQERALGATLSWQQPQPLGGFAEHSPLAGLVVDEQVRVRRQVLAEPDVDLPQRTWATLADGTPLITARREGRGWLVLVHVTASPAWSNLPLSGLFVHILERVTELAPLARPMPDLEGGGQPPSPAVLADVRRQHQEPRRRQQLAGAYTPQQMLDGRGELVPMPAHAAPVPVAAFDRLRPSPRHPAGLYARGGVRRALNVGHDGLAPKPLSGLLPGWRLAGYGGAGVRELAPPLMVAVAGLFMLDMLAMLWLASGGRPWQVVRRQVAAAVAVAVAASGLVLVVMAGGVPPAKAQQAGPGAADMAREAQQHDGRPLAAASAEEARRLAFAMMATRNVRLVFVKTGDAQLDALVMAGLRGLSEQLFERTSVEPDEPLAIDPERDEIAFFPLIYWPVTADARLPSPAAMRRLETYLRNGGVILFDTRDAPDAAIAPDGLTPQRRALRRILEKLDVPPLEPVPPTHVLTRSFFLLKSFPGRFAGARLWVEAGSIGRERRKLSPANADGVSAVLITGNDLAGAWAVSASGQPLLPVVPGGARQREMAYRVGINIVMYALTGNYKADQVHLPTILQRLGQ